MKDLQLPMITEVEVAQELAILSLQEEIVFLIHAVFS